MATRFPKLATPCALLSLFIVGCLSTCRPAALAGDRPAKAPLEERLSRIIIPKLELREATFAESLDFILHKVQELDPTGRAIKTTQPLEVDFPATSGAAAASRVPNIPGLDAVTSPAPAGKLKLADLRMTLELSKIPALEALKYVASLSNLQLRIDGDTLHFTPMDAAKSPAASPHK